MEPFLTSAVQKIKSLESHIPQDQRDHRTIYIYIYIYRKSYTLYHNIKGTTGLNIYIYIYRKSYTLYHNIKGTTGLNIYTYIESLYSLPQYQKDHKTKHREGHNNIQDQRDHMAKVEEIYSPI